jgi:hypothetical protein
MPVNLLSAGGGTTTLTTASSASNFTLTLPAVTGTVATTATAGKVLQVVNAQFTTTASTSSTSLVDTGLTATITPSSASNKVLVFVSLNQMACDNASLVLFSIRRNGSLITRNAMGGNATTYDAFAAGGGQSTTRQQNGGSLTYLDSPATTSATTYKVQFANNGGGTAYLNQWALNTDAASVSYITLMEIAA